MNLRRWRTMLWTLTLEVAITNLINHFHHQRLLYIELHKAVQDYDFLFLFQLINYRNPCNRLYFPNLVSTNKIVNEISNQECPKSRMYIGVLSNQTQYFGVNGHCKAMEAWFSTSHLGVLGCLRLCPKPPLSFGSRQANVHSQFIISSTWFGRIIIFLHMVIHLARYTYVFCSCLKVVQIKLFYSLKEYINHKIRHGSSIPIKWSILECLKWNNLEHCFLSLNIYERWETLLFLNDH